MDRQMGFTPQEWARRARALHRAKIASDVEIDRRGVAAR